MGANLPHGAKGVEFDDLVIEQGRDKIVFLAKSAGDHYTFQAGTKSRIINLHRTWRDGERVTQHETLYAIEHDRIPALLQTCVSWPAEILGLLRPLRIGWVHRHGIGIVRGLDPITDGEVASITRKRRKRLVVDEQRWKASISVPEYLEAIREFPDGAFSLFSGQRRIGAGIKATDARGNMHLYWLKVRDLARLGKRWEEQLADALRQHAVPPERYPTCLVEQPAPPAHG